MADVHAQHKRSHTGFLFMGEQSTNPIAATKRRRTTPATTISHNPKEKKKDKIGERVAALQQLVSPFGKTDTASVLLEATEYVRFLHDQLQVLSAPYIAKATAGKEAGNNNSLRSRGLCLAPVSSTLTVARSNGADIWAAINTVKHT